MKKRLGLRKILFLSVLSLIVIYTGCYDTSAFYSDWIHCPDFLCEQSFSACLSGFSIEKRRSVHELNPENKFLLFIFDLESFFCFSCLEPFIEFYHLLPSEIQSEMTFGVVVVKEGGKKREVETDIQILKKKLSGFKKANKIRCPILLDQSRIFGGLAEGGTTLLLFDGRTQNVKKYSFPLNREKKKEILSFLKVKKGCR